MIDSEDDDGDFINDNDNAVGDDDADSDHYHDSTDDDFGDVKHLIYLLPLLKEQFDQTNDDDYVDVNVNVNAVDDDDDADSDHSPDDDFGDVKHLIYLLPLLK